jgi:serine/threonine protein phosphatase 1
MESIRGLAPHPATPPGVIVYAIGDIHGRSDLLRGALAVVRDAIGRIGPGQRLALVFLGDYIDRGPASKVVIDDLIAFNGEGRCETVFLRGNHEQVLLDVLDGESEGPWLQHGGRETLGSYGLAWTSNDPPKDLRARIAAALPASHVEFLRATTLTATYGDYLFVHAGLRPDRLIEEQSTADLLWFRYYDDEPPLHGATVIHGHTPNRSPVLGRHRISIDTKAYASGALTLLQLEGTQKVFHRIVASEGAPAIAHDLWPDLDSAYQPEPAPRLSRAAKGRFALAQPPDHRRRAWAFAATVLVLALIFSGFLLVRGGNSHLQRDTVARRVAAAPEPTPPPTTLRDDG